MNISNILKYFTSADSTGKSTSNIDTQLEYNLLGQFLNGTGYIAGENNELCYVNNIEASEKEQLQTLYNSLKSKYNSTIGKMEIEITDENATQYTSVLKNFQILYNTSDMDEESQDSLNKIQKALYQYVLDNNYELDGLQEGDINYEFVIDEILRQEKEKTEKTEKSISVDNVNEADESNSTDEEEFVPNKNLALYEVDIDTITHKPKDGMFAINGKGIKIVYDNKHYYSPDYPDLPAEKNIYGLIFNINIEFGEKIEKELTDVFRSNKSEAEKKEYFANLIKNFTKWSYNTNKNFLYGNGIKPGQKEYARVGNISMPFTVGEDYTPQFNLEKIYSDFQNKYGSK